MDATGDEHPVCEPFNDAAHRIVHCYLDHLALPKSPKKIDKYRSVVASLLYSIRKVVNAQQGRMSEEGDETKPVYLGAAMGHDNWTIYPLVGRDIAKRTIDTFVEAGLLIKVEGSGQRHFYETENGKIAYRAIMTMWQVDASFNDDPDLEDARFIETGRPLVLVNVIETRNQKERRERFGEARKRLSQADCAKHPTASRDFFLRRWLQLFPYQPILRMRHRKRPASLANHRRDIASPYSA